MTRLLISKTTHKILLTWRIEFNRENDTHQTMIFKTINKFNMRCNRKLSKTLFPFILYFIDIKMVQKNVELQKTPFFQKEKFGTDFLWERLPHISIYQLRITGTASYAAVFGGLMTTFPVFAQYTPPFRCETAFDNNKEFSWLTWEQIKSLTTSTPFCR